MDMSESKIIIIIDFRKSMLHKERTINLMLSILITN